MKRALAAALAALALAALPAGADTTSTQTIDAAIAGTITMSTTPSATVSSWNLSASGANTVSGGTIVVAANTPYKVTVMSDVAKMTQWTGTAYVTPSPKVLTSLLSVLTSLTGGAGVAVPAVAVGTTAQNIATGTGLSTDTYSLSLSQPTVITDAPASYHMVLTYTATANI